MLQIISILLALILWLMPTSLLAQPTTQPVEKEKVEEKTPEKKEEPPKKVEEAEEEEEEEEEDDDDDEEELDLDKAPFTKEQKEFLKKWSKKFDAPVEKSAPPKASLNWRAEIYNKILYQNDQSQGSVTFGTPHPRGDNYGGNNGFAE